MKNKAYKISASLICADMLHLEDEVSMLEKGGADFIHFDVMDGHFVPRLGLHPEVLVSLKKVTKIPIGVHLMIDNPEDFIPDFAKAGADYIVVHAEATKHLDRVIKKILATGVKAGVALNPHTPLAVLDYVLGDIDLVMLMAINPGIVGHKLIPKMLEKIKHLKEKLANYPNMLIEIDGGVSPESAATMVSNGANMLVCGTSSIFKPPTPLDKKIREFRTQIDAELKMTK